VRDIGVDLDYYNDLELVVGGVTNGLASIDGSQQTTLKDGRLDVLLAADEADLDSMLKELCEGTF
jgi:hypothetical protein